MIIRLVKCVMRITVFMMSTFYQEVLKQFIFPKTYEPFILVTEICLEFEDLFKFDSLEACKGEKAMVCWLAQP